MDGLACQHCILERGRPADVPAPGTVAADHPELPTGGADKPRMKVSCSSDAGNPTILVR
jgi:hypothetical protein